MTRRNSCKTGTDLLGLFPYVRAKCLIRNNQDSTIIDLSVSYRNSVWICKYQDAELSFNLFLTNGTVEVVCCGLDGKSSAVGKTDVGLFALRRCSVEIEKFLFELVPGDHNSLHGPGVHAPYSDTDQHVFSVHQILIESVVVAHCHEKNIMCLKRLIDKKGKPFNFYGYSNNQVTRFRFEQSLGDEQVLQFQTT
jgi:hypothetical protein